MEPRPKHQETSGTKPKEQQMAQNSQQSQTPPTQMKHPKKKLITSLSLDSNLSDRPKDSKVKSVNSAPPLSSNVQDPVYARISRPLHSKSNKDYKNQHLGPLPDFVTLSEDISSVLEEKEEGEIEDDDDEEDQMSSEQLVIHSKFQDSDAETIYSEVKSYDDYGGKNEAVDNIEDCTYFCEPHSASLPVCSDLKDFQAVGFNKNYKNLQFGSQSNFLKPSQDISCMGQEEQLDMSMEQLAIHWNPDVYGAESTYPQETHSYDYRSTDESVDNVEGQEYFYPPCASDTYFKKGPSNLEDSQAEEYSTYDNLPKRL